MGKTLTGTWTQFLPEEMAQEFAAPFEACARYYEAMDYLLYLTEDVAHRADRVDRFLTILWHPTEDRAIGVKLKGFRHLFGRIKEILQSQGAKLSDQEFLPLVTALEVALTAGGAALLAEAQQKRLEERYAKARELIKSVKLDLREMPLAA